MREAQARDACVRAVLVWADAGPPHEQSRPPPATSPDHAHWVARRILYQATERVRGTAAVRIEERAVFGAPVRTLLAESDGADLLVLGARGHGGTGRMLAGSVSLACAHGATVPVVVVHGPVRVTDERPRTVVVGVDGSDASADALRWAADEAELHGASLRVVQVRPRSPREDATARGVPAAATRSTTTVLEEMTRAALAGRPGPPATTDLLYGHTTQRLIEAAADAQLLVVGARGSGGFTDLLLGSTSSQCVMYAPCPVAVIR